MLKLRALTAVVLLIGFGAALFLMPGWAWMLFCALVLVPSTLEWGCLAGLSSGGRSALVVVAELLLWAVLEAPVPNLMAISLAVACAFWILAVPVWLHQRPRPGHAVLASVGLLVLVPAFAALVALRAQGAWVLLAVMAVAWVSDTAAYLGGRRFGRRKLAPSISPGKSWEGLGAGLVAVAVYSLLVWMTAPALLTGRATWLAFVLAGLVLAVLGVMGDLMESQLKRAAGVKDSGTILPGHGGILDRIDALLPILPAAAWLLARFGE